MFKWYNSNLRVDAKEPHCVCNETQKKLIASSFKVLFKV